MLYLHTTPVATLLETIQNTLKPASSVRRVKRPCSHALSEISGPHVLEFELLRMLSFPTNTPLRLFETFQKMLKFDPCGPP